MPYEGHRRRTRCRACRSGQIDPAAAARLIKDASPGAKLVAFALDETITTFLRAQLPAFRGASRVKATRTSASGFSGRSGRAHALRAAHRRCDVQLPHRLIAGTQPARLAPSLSSRESEIPAFVEQGRSNKEIARQRAISSATVKNHMHNILQKLQVNRRGQAAARLRAYRAY